MIVCFLPAPLPAEEGRNCTLVFPNLFSSDPKPSYSSEGSARKKLLRIKVISGQHLPKTEEKLKGDIIEPYVKVRVWGHPDDEGEYVTKVVPKVSQAVSTYPSLGPLGATSVVALAERL